MILRKQPQIYNFVTIYTNNMEENSFKKSLLPDKKNLLPDNSLDNDNCGEGHIQAIILDLGNVIARIDPERTLNGLSAFTSRDQLGKEALRKYGTTIFLYETGQIDEGEFIEELYNFLHQSNPDLPQGVPSKETLKDIWNSMILSIPRQHLDLLQHIRKNYRLYLLSNTNSMHMEYVDLLIPEESRPFSQYFDYPFCSYQLQLHKPDPAIYTKVCQQADIEPRHCLFIDDRAENIEGARKAGLHAHLLEDFQLSELFNGEGRLKDELLSSLMV